MDSKEFILQLNTKGYKATELHGITVQEIHEEELLYSTITKYINSQSLGPNIEPFTRIIKWANFSKDPKIYKSLSENPDFTVRENSVNERFISTVHFKFK